MGLRGYKFHSLRGDRKGEYAFLVTGNWQLPSNLPAKMP
jgi:plasmid maintenance system killer protein